MKVAVVGLGVMGQGMAGQLLAHGHALAVYNRGGDRATELVARGARGARTPREAAEGAEVVLTMVSNDAALHAVAEGTDGFLGAVDPGAIVLQMSTVGPDTTSWLAAEVDARGAALVDAPVLGSKAEAAESRLWVLAGARAAALARVRPVLDSISQTVYHVGDVGQGTRLKLCFNLVGGGVVAALAEGVALVEAVGLDPQLYIKVMEDSQLPRRLMVGKATQMAARDYAPRFSLDNMAKDIALALALGRAQGLNLQQGAATLATLRRGAEVAGGDRDMAAAVEAARRASGREEAGG